MLIRESGSFLKDGSRSIECRAVDTQQKLKKFQVFEVLCDCFGKKRRKKLFGEHLKNHLQSGRGYTRLKQGCTVVYLSLEQDTSDLQ